MQRTCTMRQENKNICVRFSWLMKYFSSSDIMPTPNLVILRLKTNKKFPIARDRM